MQPDVLVVVPTYNEAENIEPIARAVRSHEMGLLIVDDGSPDGTGDIADQLAAADERVSVLHRTEKQGLGPAYVAGFMWGLENGAEIICEMDADFSHDPNDLPRLVEAVVAGADLAIGSRYVDGGGVENWPWHRRASAVGLRTCGSAGEHRRRFRTGLAACCRPLRTKLSRTGRGIVGHFLSGGTPTPVSCSAPRYVT